jgi:hypothetical protein
MSELVECRSEVTYADRPTAVVWEGQRLAVQEILARWRIPDGMRFKVIIANGLVFELDYHENLDEWEVKLS